MVGSFFNKYAGISSGPAALKGLRPERRLATPAGLIEIGCIPGTSFAASTWVRDASSTVNTEEKYWFRMLALSWSSVKNWSLYCMDATPV